MALACSSGKVFYNEWANLFPIFNGVTVTDRFCQDVGLFQGAIDENFGFFLDENGEATSDTCC